MVQSSEYFDEMLSWIWCPVCQKKSRIRVRDDTTLINFPLCCPKCKCETLISVYNGKVRIIHEPDAKDAELMNKV